MEGVLPLDLFEDVHVAGHHCLRHDVHARRDLVADLAVLVVRALLLVKRPALQQVAQLHQRADIARVPKQAKVFLHKRIVRDLVMSVAAVPVVVGAVRGVLDRLPRAADEIRRRGARHLQLVLQVGPHVGARRQQLVRERAQSGLVQGRQMVGHDVRPLPCVRRTSANAPCGRRRRPRVALRFGIFVLPLVVEVVFAIEIAVRNRKLLRRALPAARNEIGFGEVVARLQPLRRREREGDAVLAAEADGAGADALQPAGRIDPQLRVVVIRTMDLGDESAVREQDRRLNARQVAPAALDRPRIRPFAQFVPRQGQKALLQFRFHIAPQFSANYTKSPPGAASYSGLDSEI